MKKIIVNPNIHLNNFPLLNTNYKNDPLLKVTDNKGNIYFLGNVSKDNDYVFINKLNSQSKTIFSTYLSGSGNDYGLGIDVDNEGNIYVVGMTTSIDFPVTNNAQQKTLGGVADAFVVKINPNLSGKDSIIYATYLGGGQSDFGLGIKVDKDGAAYVTGRTNSTDFPVTLSSVQPYSRGSGETFLTKLKPDGTIDFSTYFGGTGSDYAHAIDLDDAGNPCIAGTTDSQDLLVSFNAFQPRPAGKSDAFVTCLNQAGNSILYSTYFGGSGFDDAFEIKIPGKNKIQIKGSTDGILPYQNVESIRDGGDNNFKAEFEIQDINLSKNNSEKQRK